MKIMPYTTPVLITDSNVEYNSDKNGDMISDLRAERSTQEFYNEDESSVNSIQNFEKTHTLDKLSRLYIDPKFQNYINDLNQKIINATKIPKINLYKDLS